MDNDTHNLLPFVSLLYSHQPFVAGVKKPKGLPLSMVIIAKICITGRLEGNKISALDGKHINSMEP